MQRVALVGTIKPGKEAEIWRAQDQFKGGTSDGKRLPGFETFIGSGYFVMVIDAPVQDFQNRFREQFNSGPLQKFMQTVMNCVEGMPSGSYRTGEQQRQHNGSNGFSSADLPLAALAGQFTPEGGWQTFTEQNNSGATARRASGD